MRVNYSYKLILLIVFAITFSCYVYAQENFRFGVTGGILSSTQKYNYNGTSDTENSKTGFDFGFMLEGPINRSLMLDMGLCFAIKGYSYNTEPSQSRILENFSYMEMPLYLACNLAISKNKLAVVPYAGFYFGFLIEAQNSIDSRDYDFAEEYFNTFDSGFKLGAAIDIGKNMRIGIEKNLGFINLYKTDENSNMNDNKLYNQDTRTLLTFFF